MPAAIPAVIAAASAYASGATIFGLSAALSATLIGIGSFALNTLGAMMAPKPKKQNFADLSSSRTQQVKEPVTERRIIYGECKVSGCITYFGSTEDNKFLHIVITLATHQCQAIKTVWFNDDPIHDGDVDTDGQVIGGKYAGKARIKKHLGQAGQIVDADLLAEISEITEDFVGNEITYLYARLEKDEELYKSGLPNIQGWLQGALILDARTGTTYWTPNSVLCLRDYMTHTKYGLSTPVTKFPDANIIAGANSCEEMVATKPLVHTVTNVTITGTLAAPVTAPSLAIGAAGNISSHEHSYVVTFVAGGIESEGSPSATIDVPGQNSQVNLSSIPTGGVGVTARKIYRTKQRGTIPFLVGTIADNVTTTYTDNVRDEDLGAAVPHGSRANRLDLDGKLLQFQTGDRVQLTTTGALPTGLSLATNYYVICVQIVDSLSIKLASSYLNALAGTAVTLTAAGSGVHTITKNAEPRYTTNGTLGTGAEPRNNISDLLSAMAGDILPVGGRWLIKPAVWVAPTVSFDEDDLCGALEITPKHSRRERFNAVQGLYVTPANLGEPTDYPLCKDATYVAEDGGQVVIAQLDLPMTSRSQTAMRIGFVQLNRHRRQRTVQLTTNMTGLQVTSGNTFSLSLANHGYVSKSFEVGDFNLVPRTDKNGRPMLTCDIVANESDSAIYDFDETTQELVPQPPQSIVRGNPDNVTKPGTPVVTEVKYVTTDGTGVKVRGDVVWSPSTDFFVRQYQAGYKLKSDPDYTDLPPTLVPEQSIYDLAPGIYDIRVKAVSIFDASSEYVYSTFTIIGLSDIPADVDNFSAISLSDDVTLSWSPATDIDVRIAGFVRLRHSVDSVNPSWTDARDIVDQLPGVTTQAHVPLLAGAYMAKFVDSSGNESATEALILVTGTQIFNMDLKAEAIEHTAFGGTKTNMVAIDSVLRLDGSGLFDSASGNFDSAANTFDQGNGGGQQVTGTYQFLNKLNTGAVVKSWVSSNIDLTIYNSLDVFDLRDGEFDAASGLFDGGDIIGISTKMYIRTSNVDYLVDPLNLFASTQITDASFSKVRCSASADVATAPDGTATADKLVEDATASATHLMQITPFAISSGVTYTYSVFVKAGERDKFQLRYDESGVNTNTALFDLNARTGTAVVASPGVAIEAYPNGWFKCSITVTSAATACRLSLLLCNSAGTSSYTGDGASGLYVWGLTVRVGAGAYSPWSDWQQFVAGYFTAKYYDFKLEVISNDSVYQVDIAELSVSINVPDVIDGGVITTSAGALAPFTYNKTFSSAPLITGMINDAQAGDLLVVPQANITTSNYQAGVLNSGSYVVRNVTMYIRGT